MNQEMNVKIYDEQWSKEFKKLNSDELLRISKILHAFSLIDQREGGLIARIDKDKRRICDLGCGTGWISYYLSQLGQVTGVDYSAKGIEAARKKYPDVSFEIDDVTSYRATHPYDVIVSSEVIEHISDKIAFRETCMANLKPGGFLILTCPNGRYLSANQGGVISDQPIEIWPTKRELLRLFSTSFKKYYYDTFRTDYFYTGINRLINSYKVRSFIKKHDLDLIYDAVIGRVGIGLYQCLILIKK